MIDVITKERLNKDLRQVRFNNDRLRVKQGKKIKVVQYPTHEGVGIRVYGDKFYFMSEQEASHFDSDGAFEYCRGGCYLCRDVGEQEMDLLW